MSETRRNFMGATIAVFIGHRLAVLQRDDRPGLLWPGFWDLPGGGREGRETPLVCALRETREELSLRIPPAHIVWGRAYTNSIGHTVWFFVGHLPETAANAVRLGDEGQGWDLMTVDAFAVHDRAVPQFQARLYDYRNGVAPDVGYSEV